jgi:hypothetical protein
MTDFDFDLDVDLDPNAPPKYPRTRSSLTIDQGLHQRPQTTAHPNFQTPDHSHHQSELPQENHHHQTTKARRLTLPMTLSITK